MQTHFRCFKVRALALFGAFLAWEDGRPDLLLPKREQTSPVEAGDEIVVAVYLDDQGRPTASMHLESFLDPRPTGLRLDQKVDLLIYACTDLGYKAIINDRQAGVLYHNEVFQELEYGQRLPGYIKKVRADGKIDLSLQALGVQGTPELSLRILEELRHQGGYLDISEDSPPEAIYRLFGVSKKKYKIALGALYKQRKIALQPDGVRLLDG